jgi:RPA family protein
MEGSARVFAGDFCRSSCYFSTPGTDSSLSVVTPSGIWCNRVFAIGVLTEVSGNGARLHARLADPTGAFDIEIAAHGDANRPDMFQKIPVPSFIAINGRAYMAGSEKKPVPVIRVESVRIVDRAVRDTGIARTADSTLAHLMKLAGALIGGPADDRTRAVLRHYHTTPGDINDSIAIVEKALAGLSETGDPAHQPVQDPHEVMIGIIRGLQGPRGVVIEDVIAQAGIRGISPDAARGIIDDMIKEDECYQPQKGSIRLL